MNARRKLNTTYIYGCILVAGWVGLVLQSWWGFGIALGVLLALNVWGGSIRLAPVRER
jgi:hypothetical protein